MKKLYWLFVLILIIPQIIFTLNSHQIRYEELNSAVRSPFLFQHHLITDGSSTVLGWYYLLLPVYNFFGFSLSTAKVVKIFLHALSILALAALLKKYLGEKYALLPLATIALSPTLLYFNSLSLEYGLPLQYLPICLYLVTTIDFKAKFKKYFQQIFFWVITMVAWMSYGAFVFYLPILFYIYFKELLNQRAGKKKVIPNIIISMLAFITPILGILNVKNNLLLIYDPLTKSGLFRGSGNFSLTHPFFLQNTISIIRDFFFRGTSYNFEIFKADFSDFFPIVTLVLVAGVSIYLLIKHSKLRLPIILVYLCIIISFIVISLTSDPVSMFGMRRNTTILAGIYALFTITWYYVVKRNWVQQIKIFMILIFSLLFVHELLIFPINLSHLNDPSRYKYTFGGPNEKSPNDSLNKLVDQVQGNDLYIKCSRGTCGMEILYSSIAGSCLWNKLNCHNILGYDFKSSSFVRLSPEVFRSANYDFGTVK